jgi:hypothetical protein
LRWLVSAWPPFPFGRTTAQIDRDEIEHLPCSNQGLPFSASRQHIEDNQFRPTGR